MTEETKNFLIHRSGTNLANVDKGNNPVLNRMTQDVLARAQERGLNQARFRIGHYLLREPDYRQILFWSEALGMAPDAVLAVLAKTRSEPHYPGYFEPITFSLSDGAIFSLAWNWALLPLIPAICMPGLHIRRLGIYCIWPCDGPNCQVPEDYMAVF